MNYLQSTGEEYHDSGIRRGGAMFAGKSWDEWVPSIRVEAARKYYRRYLDHWGETDNPIAEVEKARVRLRELGPEPG